MISIHKFQTHKLICFLIQTWCEKMSKESLLNQVLTNPHSPAKFRIMGPLSNSEDFVQAFSCSKDAKMNRKSKCILW